MRLVAVHELSDTWPKVCGWIEQALEYGPGDENLLDIFIALAREQYQLYIGEHVAVIVQVQRYPRQNVLVVLYFGGLMSEVKKAFEFGKDLCRKNGLAMLRVHGRPGWERVLGLEKRSTMAQVRV